MISAENLKYPSNGEAVNKTNYTLWKKYVYLICDTNSTLSSMHDESMKMFWTFILQSTLFFILNRKT